MMDKYILNIQNNKGERIAREVEAKSSHEAVNNNLEGKWVQMSNNELPRGMYETGTYSFEKGYVTVKKPNRVYDWFKKSN